MSDNNFFEHAVVPQNSQTSPVENLANEVSTAFDNVAGVLGKSTILPNLSKAIGNYVLNDVAYHGIVEETIESFSITNGMKDLVLTGKPVNKVSVSYADLANNKEVFLTEKQPTQEFSSKNDFKVLGKVVVLAGNFEGKTLKISYNKLEVELGDKTVKPNVLKNTDNTYIKKLVGESDTEFSIEYNVNLQENKDKYFSHGLEDSIYLIVKDDGYKLIDFSSVSLSNNKIIFNIDNGLEKEYEEAIVYVLNITISEMLEALYTEFYKHSHSKEGFSKNIEHSDVVNNYVNSNTIFYKDSDTPNYPHPQFLNREGYNPSVTSAYENSLLGDLLLASVVTESDQMYKSIDKNSVKVLFGDPIAGSKLYFDKNLKAINLLTGSGLNGLNIAVGTGYKALSINNNTYVGEFEEGLRVKGKANRVSFVSNGDSKATISTEDLIVSNKASVETGSFSNIFVGDVLFKNSDLKTTISKRAKLEGESDESYASIVLYADIPVNFDKVVANNLNIINGTLANSLKTSDDSVLLNSEGSFEFNLNGKFLNIKQHTGRNSGLKLSNPFNSSSFYSADYLGQVGTAADSNLYLESPLNTDLYLIKNTNLTVDSNGKKYVFQKDLEGTERVDSLKEWFKSDVHFSKGSGDKLELKANAPGVKNGLKIGTTIISTIGDSADCPEGTTIIESASVVNIVKPTGSDVKCSGVSYQDVNTGSLQVFGNGAVDGTLTVVNNTSIGGTLTTDFLVALSDTSLKNVTITGDTSISGSIELTGEVSVSNNMTITGALGLTGSLIASDGAFTKFVSIGETLTVGGQAIFSSTVIVQGDITTTRNIVSNGSLTSASFKTGDAAVGALTVQGSIVAIGGLSIEGSSEMRGNLEVQGNINTNGSLEVGKELTAASLYITDDTTLIGRLITEGPVTMSTESLSLGSTNATLSLFGNLQVTGLKTTLTGSLNVQSEVVLSSTLKVSEAITCTGDIFSVNLKVSSSLNVGGNVTANSGEFSKKVIFQDGIKASGSSEFTQILANTITTTSISTDDIYVRNVLSMGPDAKLTAYTVEVSQFIQKDPSNESSFAGQVVFNNLVKFTDKFVVGNPEIISKRNTSGCLITDNQIKLGNNSTIEAVKIFAGKGAPVAGNRDFNAGFCFASGYIDSGVDGDTGLFATQGQGVGLDGSDLEFWIDGVRRYCFPKYEIAYNNREVKNKEVAVTLKMLQQMQADLEAKITSSTSSMMASSWPVNSIYITMDERNPGTIFKFGTWVRFAAGRSLVGRVTGQSSEQGGTIIGGLLPPVGWSMNSVGSVFGTFSHILTEWEMPRHSHNIRLGVPANNGRKDIQDWWDQVSTSHGGVVTEPAGGSVAHNNVQPSIVVNIWQRIA